MSQFSKGSIGSQACKILKITRSTRDKNGVLEHSQETIRNPELFDTI